MNDTDVQATNTNYKPKVHKNNKLILQIWLVYDNVVPGSTKMFIQEHIALGKIRFFERISVKDHGGPKCPSVVPFKILHSKGPFEVDNFEHFGLERPFNKAAMIVFTPKGPSEGEISRFEHTVIFLQLDFLLCHHRGHVFGLLQRQLCNHEMC